MVEFHSARIPTFGIKEVLYVCVDRVEKIPFVRNSPYLRVEDVFSVRICTYVRARGFMCTYM